MTTRKISLRTLGIGCSLVIAWALGACSDSSDGGGTATGGTPGAGGQTGLGGANVGTGGSTVPGSTGGATVSTGGINTGGGVSSTGGTTGANTGGTTGTNTGGTTSGATGGSTGTTTGGSTGTGGASAVPAVPVTGFNVDAGGFITFCGWSGYSWTAAGADNPVTAGATSTITPADFATLAAETSLCASGTVVADTEYGGYAMVGVNIGQQVGEEGATEDPPNANVTPSGTGLVVNVTNNLTNSLRVQIQDDLGATDAAHRWCADVPKGGVGTIPWTDFNTTCWDDKGAFYAMEPINAIMIIVPGGNSKDTPFDFCLNGFTVEGVDCPVGTTGTGGAPGTGGSTGESGGSTGESGGSTGESGGGTGVSTGGGTGESGGASSGGTTASGGDSGSGGASGSGGDTTATGGGSTTGGDSGTGGATASAAWR